MYACYNGDTEKMLPMTVSFRLSQWIDRFFSRGRSILIFMVFTVLDTRHEAGQTQSNYADDIHEHPSFWMDFYLLSLGWANRHRKGSTSN